MGWGIINDPIFKAIFPKFFMSFYFKPPTNSKIINVPTIKYGRVGVETCLYTIPSLPP